MWVCGGGGGGGGGSPRGGGRVWKGGCESESIDWGWWVLPLDMGEWGLYAGWGVNGDEGHHPSSFC